MRKSTKTEENGKAPEPMEAPEKPKRKRKPKAASPEGTPEKTGEPEETPENAGEPEPAEMPGDAPEKAEKEPEPVEKPGDVPGNTAEEEPAENAGEEPGETPEEKPEKADGEESEKTPEKGAEMPPAPAIPTEVIESPLKRMKQEFSERAQIIREQMRNIQNAFITIGFQLHWIRENNMFRVLNYKNVYEYAEKEYGLKKTTCCNFISIIENYAERDEDGTVIESIADCYRNYSASQLVAMLGMNEDMRQQVTPDMSVRAINRLRKGEPETPPVEEEKPAERQDAEEDTPEFPAEDTPETKEDETPEEREEAGNTAEEPTEEPKEEKAEEAGKEERREDTPEEETGGSEEENRTVTDGTLAEIESYSDYQSMADELDLIMRHVFSVDAPVRVKIVCVQG
ncbi:MAG: hypothetical protein NC548_53185 [Lachnospiraceae bacterium]|nr:hypothetical protein [Lachnospiraceae bacterium]